MALKYLLLGLLDVAPRTGYQMDKICRHALSNFWGSDQRQVYHALATMETDGWIIPEIVIQEGPPNKKVYSITAKGQRALQDWLTTPLPPQPPRLDWMGQLFFGGSVEPGALQKLIDARRERLEARIKALWGHIADYRRTIENPEIPWLARNVALRMLIFRYSLAQYREERIWLEHAQAAIDWLATTTPEDFDPARTLMQSLYDDFADLRSDAEEEVDQIL